MSLPHQIRIGTRTSALAHAQTDLFAQALLAAWPALAGRLRVCPMLTTGDVIRDKPLYDIGGKALFCRELDQALLDGTIDLAVHSLKDVPTELPKGLCLAAVLPRADCRDVLVSRGAVPLHHLPPGAVVGTSAPRRRAILMAAFPHLLIRPVRGNVPTRLQMVDDGQVDAVLLAHAGLLRLNLMARITAILPPDVMLPAATQGIVAAVCRSDDHRLRQLLATVNDAATWQQALCERALLATLDGSCRTPIAAWADFGPSAAQTSPETMLDALTLHALLAAPDGSKVFRTTASGPVAEAESIGQRAGQEIIAAAGPEFMLLLRQGSV
jgi:hydroxymethylbilane synthase